MSVRRFVSNSSRETIEIGGEIAQLLSSPTLLFLRGDLGAGKTTLVKGIAQALDAADPDEVTSPTFTLVHEYDGRRRVEWQGAGRQALPHRPLPHRRRAPAGNHRL